MRNVTTATFLFIATFAIVGCVDRATRPATSTAPPAPPKPALTAAQAPIPVPSKVPVSIGMMVQGRAAQPTVPKTAHPDLIDRLAQQIIAASPVVDKHDAKARDEAGIKLAACTPLLEAAGQKILWGGYYAAQGYDPAAYRLTEDSPLDYFQLTELSPVVWAKMYLSTFMFPGTYRVRPEGPFTVLEIDAQFRDGLDPGDYPYPFWHNVNKWTAYCNTQKVNLVFEGGRLVSSQRVAPPPLALKLIKRDWDERWTWPGSSGQEEPRVALYTYLFSKDNPHVAPLDIAFRNMEAGFRSQNCILCHMPDNRSHMNELLLLNYPNQALVARHSLREVIERNEMPPGNTIAHEPAGIRDETVRKNLLRLAEVFEKEADAAIEFDRKRVSPSP